MLPFGADIANVMQNLDAARKTLWDTIESVNRLDKEGSEAQFAAFKVQLTTILKETDRLTREAKLYDREFKEGEG